MMHPRGWRNTDSFVEAVFLLAVESSSGAVTANGLPKLHDDFPLAPEAFFN
jgi:hypothetical protein